MTKKGLVCNIQRYSIHDGRGIRTMIFLKGCPLTCPWCANPESRNEVKPTTWMKNGKQETIGEWKSVKDIVDEVLKDEIFFRTSGGGVTLSGGEALMQHEFVKELLKEFSDLGIHVALETAGCFDTEHLASLLPYIDQLLFDLKIMDSRLAKEVIGIDITTMKENFEMALQYPDSTVIARIPLIPKYTTKTDNLIAIIEYLKGLDIHEVHLLPFHQYGSSKYEYLGWQYAMKDIATLTKEEVIAIQELFEKYGIIGNVDGLE